MKRPAGVIVTSILLGLFAGLQLFSAALAVVAGYVTVGRGSSGALGSYTQPGMAQAPTAELIKVVTGAYALVLVLLAVWAVLTLIGLLRLRNWARYSILVIGGCLAGLGLLMLVGFVFVLAAGSAMPTSPGISREGVLLVMLFEAVLFGGVGGIGVWWLIYFSRARMRILFADPPPSLPGFPSAGRTWGQALAPPPLPPSGWGPPPPPVYVPQGRFSQLPWPIALMACLFLLSAAVCAVGALLPFPAFVGGFLISGAGGHVFYLAAAVVAALVGWGLLRLDQRARIMCFVLLGLGTINVGLLFLPWYQQRLVQYTASMYETLHMPSASAMAASVYNGPMLASSAIFSIAIYGLQIYVLYRYRAAFSGATSNSGSVAP